MNNSTSHYMELHRGLTAQVAAEIYETKDSDTPMSGGVSTWASQNLPPSPGLDGTSVTNLSCRIDIETSGKRSFSCYWTPGDKAPADTEYNLYCGHSNSIERCKNYVTEPAGRKRTGCIIPYIDLSKSSVPWIVVHINGTSRSLKIKAMEKMYESTEIETIPPVQNLKADGKGLHWTKPVQTFSDSCFQYHVNISSKSRNEMITVSQCSFNDTEQWSAVRHVIRVRAVGKEPCWKTEKYSPWTEMIPIGEDMDRSDTTGIIVSVCVIAAFFITFFLCIRCWKHLFPEIPKPKNELKEAFQNKQNQALMRCNSWDNEEVISYIEEMGHLDKYMTSAGYGHIADYSSSRLCKAL
ncbi:interleukin-5 receptor subunit alpha isoform 2-T4 [Anomaloglossus baeobatrachus]